MWELRTLMVCGGLSLLALGGCRNENTAGPPSAQEPPGAPSNIATTSDAAPAAGDPDLAVLTITTVDVDTALAVLCGLPDSKLYFKFDSAKVRPEAEQLLQQIATCVQTGPAQGKNIVVVGRTGPIGTDEYNQQLGLSRAEAVANYLRDRGVSNDRLRTESRGEAAADEAAPSTWPAERRVAVRLDPSPQEGAK